MKPIKPWPVFSVKVEGHDPFLICERSRSTASYRAFQAYREHYWRASFEDWLHIARLTRVQAVPEGLDGYGYVRRAYGVAVSIGDQVSFRNEPSIAHERGVVVYPGASTASVSVVLSCGRRTHVHPSNVVVAA